MSSRFCRWGSPANKPAPKTPEIQPGADGAFALIRRILEATYPGRVFPESEIAGIATTVFPFADFLTRIDWYRQNFSLLEPGQILLMAAQTSDAVMTAIRTISKEGEK